MPIPSSTPIPNSTATPAPLPTMISMGTAPASFMQDSSNQTTQTSSSSPNWYKISAGVGLLLVALAADALIIYTVPALIEVYETTMILDAVGTGMPLSAGLIYLHAEAISLIREGINGK
jgi:hypothetical protein